MSEKSRLYPVTKIFFIFVILLMLKSMGICWFWYIPNQFFVFLAFVSAVSNILVTNSYKRVSKYSSILFLYYIVVIEVVLFGRRLNFLGTLDQMIFHPIIITGIILLSDEHKISLFEWFVKALSLILLVSIPAWLLYLIGVPFPHGSVYDVGDGFHELYSFGFFVISYNSIGALFPRFASVFYEPGWIGTLCCFTLFGLGFNMKRLATYLCLMGILLSLSLSAIVNLVVCGLFWIVMNSKHKMIYSVGIVAFIAGIAIFALRYNNGNNALNERILERLVFDEDLGIAGNNRTNVTFDSYLEDMLTSSDRWFGISYQFDSSFTEQNDWYNRSSGITKDLLTYGIIGSLLLLFFYIFILLKFKSKKGFVFFICFIMASFIRALWRNDCYIILYFITIFELYYSSLIEQKHVINAKR